MVDSHSFSLNHTRKASNILGPNKKHNKAVPLSTIDDDNDDLMSQYRSGWCVAIVMCTCICCWLCRRCTGFVVVAKMPGVLSGKTLH